MPIPIDAEVLVEELYNTYGYSVSLDYAINYIEMNPYAAVNDFHDWLVRIMNIGEVKQSKNMSRQSRS
ncbi:MAG: hypothetical protein IKB96_03565 [Prevotella sp.]|nr:hypothetical protein [Prevotella sp.]MBR3858749.1 hypothetical protein [Bacteroidaceae bacterium]